MLLSNGWKELNILQYAERYINDGSPSGYTSLNTTSENTNPFGSTSWFNLYKCSGPPEWFLNFGSIPSWIVETAPLDWILLHPDMIQESALAIPELNVHFFPDFKVVPTASARTVQFTDAPKPDYVKLHYNGVLGRFTRSLPFKKAVAGPEINLMLIQAFKQRKIIDEFAFLPETGARILRLPGLNEDWGMVWRSSDLIGRNSAKVKYMLPLFSLFSTDRNFPEDPLLLLQIIDLSAHTPESLIIEKILSPLIDSYFQLISRLGLQPEWNAQNLLVGFDEHWDIVTVVMRDLGETDKDLTIRKGLGLTDYFLSYPYKCIDESQEDYSRRHSFMFDFKFGEYVIEPILSSVCKHRGLNHQNLRSKIKEIVQPHLDNLPDDFFPKNGYWYRFNDTVFGEKRSYVECPDPKFRPA